MIECKKYVPGKKCGAGVFDDVYCYNTGPCMVSYPVENKKTTSGRSNYVVDDVAKSIINDALATTEKLTIKATAIDVNGIITQNASIVRMNERMLEYLSMPKLFIKTGGTTGNYI